MTSVDEIYFVTTPDYPTLAATVRAKKLASYKNIRLGGIIVNRIRGKRYELKKREIENTLGLPVVAGIKM